MSSSCSNRPSPSLPASTERLPLSTEEPLSPVSSSFSFTEPFCKDSPLQPLRPKSYIDDDTKEISHELFIDHLDTAKDTWVQVMDASSEHVQQSDMEEEATSQDGSDINVEEYVMVPSEPQFTNKCWDDEALSPSTSASDGSWGEYKAKEQDLFLMGTPSSTTSSTSQYRESKLMMKADEKQPDEEGEEEARSEAASENYDNWEEHPVGGNKKQEAENDDFRDNAAPYPPPLSLNRLVVIPPYVKATLQGDSTKALVARSRQRVYKAELFKDIYVVHMSVMQLNGRLDSASFPGVATNPQAFVSVTFVDWSRDDSATSAAYVCETLRSAVTLFELLFSQLAGYDPSDIKSNDKDWSHPERFEVTSCEYADESIEMMREEFISVLVNKCLRQGLPVPDRERLLAAASISEYQEDMAMSFLDEAQ